MRAGRGFTLIEVIVVVAILGIIAALAIPPMRAARRNASVSSAAFELSLWLDGLRTRAMRDQRDLVAVVANAASAEACATAGGDTCGRVLLLQPGPGFILNDLRPASQRYPNATVVRDELLGRGLAFYTPTAATIAPPPYDAIPAFDAKLLGACGDRGCVGVRFRGDGTVDPEWPTTAVGTSKPGVALVLGSDLAGADHRAVLVTFPTGIVKTFSVAE